MMGARHEVAQAEAEGISLLQGLAKETKTGSVFYSGLKCVRGQKATEKLPKNFQKASEKFPTNFQKASKKLPKGFQKQAVNGKGFE